MPFPPNQTAARGAHKTLGRGIFNTLCSYMPICGGKVYAAAGYTDYGGSTDYNYDDAEGYAPRITYFGTTETVPFKDPSYSSTNDTEVKNKSYGSGLTSLRRKDEGDASSTVGTSGRVIQITNGRTSGEVYTSHYHNLPITNGHIISLTHPGATWYCSWYARKSNSAPSNTGTVRQSVFIFSVAFDSPNYVYNFSGYSGGDATNSSLGSPSTGATYYSAQNTMTTSWTKYDMCFTFDNQTVNTLMTIRLDNDDGRWDGSNGSKVYIDRVTLHPVNVGMQESLTVDGNSDNLDQFNFGTYAT